MPIGAQTMIFFREIQIFRIQGPLAPAGVFEKSAAMRRVGCSSIGYLKLN